jgi:TRAP-type C4-dicarboxylate transport system substrate-binding protein
VSGPATTTIRCAAAALALAAAAPAYADDAVVLRWHHAGAPQAFETGAIIAPLARSFEVDSGERLKVRVFPAMQLGGAPGDLIDQLATAKVDIIATTPTQQPGAFPRLEGLELPFIGASAEIMSKAAWTFAAGAAAADLARYKLLSISATDAAVVHAAAKPVRRLEDLRGLKVQAVGSWAAATIEALGATPAPAAEATGFVLPWLTALRLERLDAARYHTDAALHCALVIVLMNRQRHDALPADLQRAIAKATGPSYGAEYGRIFDRSARDARQMALDLGHQVVELAPGELARWREATRPVHDAWIAALAVKGLDGAALYRDLRAAVERAGAGS